MAQAQPGSRTPSSCSRASRSRAGRALRGAAGAGRGVTAPLARATASRKNGRPTGALQPRTPHRVLRWFVGGSDPRFVDPAGRTIFESLEAAGRSVGEHAAANVSRASALEGPRLIDARDEGCAVPLGSGGPVGARPPTGHCCEPSSRAGASGNRGAVAATTNPPTALGRQAARRGVPRRKDFAARRGGTRVDARTA